MRETSQRINTYNSFSSRCSRTLGQRWRWDEDAGVLGKAVRPRQCPYRIVCAPVDITCIWLWTQQLPDIGMVLTLTSLTYKLSSLAEGEGLDLMPCGFILVVALLFLLLYA
eukprot:scaffold219591_cov43-Tisochrysis_lutea.AAC.1